MLAYRFGVGDPCCAELIPIKDACLFSLDPPHGRGNGFNDNDKEYNTYLQILPEFYDDSYAKFFYFLVTVPKHG